MSESLESTEKAVENGSSPSQLESSIIRQVEYYFGDTNLARDKFLQEQVAKDSDGWVTLTVLLTFKRLAALTTDPDVVCKALDKSTSAPKIVEISEDRTKMRRHPENPLPEQNEETRKEVQSRTVYVKGFPVESTIEDLLEYFQPFEKVINIQMRRRPDKKDGETVHVFKGSCFVTFSTREQAQEFISKEKVEYKETDLIRMFKADYLEKSKLEHAEEKKKKKQQQQEEEESQFTLPTGALLHVSDIGPESTIESLKAAFAKLEADVAFVEYQRGEKEATVRLKAENSAKTLFEKLEGGKVTLDGVEATARVLEGDEEKDFIAKTIKAMAERRNFKKKGGKANKGFGKYQNHKKRAAAASEDEPPAKK
ncbi:la protein homolog [Phlebotomus papatasi]|uniref:la protein homolog n=1 Tax=Phlebotomus papatasi TaxID=29031 RepID=UPI002483EF7B|nr:la protein homolog [Phlebotomus papatasi]XP_055701540.1 la protein homolog [Phlebotomus papatasi]